MVEVNGKELTEEETAEMSKRIIGKITKVIEDEFKVKLKEIDVDGKTVPLLTIGFSSLSKDNDPSDIDKTKIERPNLGMLGWFPGSLSESFFNEYTKAMVLIQLDSNGTIDTVEKIGKELAKTEEGRKLISQLFKDGITTKTPEKKKDKIDPMFV